ncbi:hypothetical protein V6N13_055117 [Hibiscus sabdariffa]|uniref:Uncharacterized protein n=1 Tax=Hibiscus sabdariffa TaxID=183260 RepID=A0ABR2DXF8_9ROSI
MQGRGTSDGVVYNTCWGRGSQVHLRQDYPHVHREGPAPVVAKEGGGPERAYALREGRKDMDVIAVSSTSCNALTHLFRDSLSFYLSTTRPMPCSDHHKSQPLPTLVTVETFCNLKEIWKRKICVGPSTWSS